MIFYVIVVVDPTPMKTPFPLPALHPDGVGTGWGVRPTEVRERQERPSRERRRQRGHLANFNQLKMKRRKLEYLRPKPAARSPVNRAVAIASPPNSKGGKNPVNTKKKS